MKAVIIQGSSRSEGNSSKIVEIIKKRLSAEVIDLNRKNINAYSYNPQHKEDDFIPTMRSILNYDTIILVTPVYWYSMSGIMKTFFDRITECLKSEKEIGRKLRGKNMIAVSCGSDDFETEGFFVPFKNTAEYLGLNYLGDIHTWINNDQPEQEVLDRIDLFLSNLIA